MTYNMNETSLISLEEAIEGGRTLSKGEKVSLPIGGDAEIYGFIAIENDVFSFAIDMPPLGEGKVLSNRVIFSLNNKLHRFPVFNSVCKAIEEKYELYLLYIPKFYNLSEWGIKVYTQSMKNEVPNSNVSKIKGVRIEDKKAYYYPDNGDLYFQSTSKLRGIGNGVAVITRRLSKLSEDIKYEIFNPQEVMIEKI